jgi:hypothetical protein
MGRIKRRSVRLAELADEAWVDTFPENGIIKNYGERMDRGLGEGGSRNQEDK